MPTQPQTRFQELVNHLKKKHKMTQKQIEYILDLGENTISRCYHMHQGNTGSKFVPDLERLIAKLEEKKSDSRQIKQHETSANQHKEEHSEQPSTVQINTLTQVFVPEYELGKVFCCPSCYSINGLQQEATEICMCIHCGIRYKLKENTPVTATRALPQEVIPTYKRGSQIACHKCGHWQEAMRRGRCWKCGATYNTA
jgi:hypothetical protein